MARRTPSERVSDRERERVVESLSAHAVAGRLDMEELAERAEAAYAARTVGELALVLRDLPPRGPRVRVRSIPVPVLTRFRLLLLVTVVALAVNLGILTVVGNGIGGPPGARSFADEAATISFWALAAWLVLLVVLRGIHAARHLGLRSAEGS